MSKAILLHAVDVNTTSESLLRVADLRVGYGGAPLLPPIDFAVRRGELWAIAGPNGAGKTTLLKTLLGLVSPLSGTMEMPPRVGYVPQRTRLGGRLPGRVVDVIRSGVDEGWSFLRPGHLRRRRGDVERAMELTGCAELLRQDFRQLSEGQKQRVLVARALAGVPDILVFDEPTSAMDIETEHRTMHLLDEIRTTADVGVLLVSHHLAVVAEFATHLVVLDRDLQNVVAGPIGDVGRDPAVTSRYGDLFVDPQKHTASHFAATGHPHECGAGAGAGGVDRG